MKYVLFFLLAINFYAYSQDIKVTIIGSGSPEPSYERGGASTLVQIKDEYFLFDCGMGCAQRIWQNKVSLGKINKVFITHLHSDHILGLDDLWMTSQLPLEYGNRKEPLTIWGPLGIKELGKNLNNAYSFDINIRSKSDTNILKISKLITNTINKEGIVYDKDGILITAFNVDHFLDGNTAYGYKITYNGKSLVISGDTKFSENLVKYSQGVDVLIHEVGMVSKDLTQKFSPASQILKFHSESKDISKIASLANPKYLVLNHILILNDFFDKNSERITTNDILNTVKENYLGSVIVSNDNMEIIIGDKIVIRNNLN